MPTLWIELLATSFALLALFIYCYCSFFFFFSREGHSFIAGFQGTGSNLPNFPQLGHQVLRGLHLDASCMQGLVLHTNHRELGGQVHTQVSRFDVLNLLGFHNVGQCGIAGFVELRQAASGARSPGPHPTPAPLSPCPF